MPHGIPAKVSRPVASALLATQVLMLLPITALAAPVVDTSVAASGAALDPVGNRSDRLKSQGEEGVDKSTGAFTYRYTLALPEGRNGMTPDLEFAYNSQSRDNGWLGYGWSLSIPYVDRENKYGSLHLYDQPTFSSSLHGELSSSDGINFEEKVDDGSYAKYRQYDKYWTMQDRDGKVYTFGDDPTARIEDTNSGHIGRWYVTSV